MRAVLHRTVEAGLCRVPMAPKPGISPSPAEVSVGRGGGGGAPVLGSARQDAPTNKSRPIMNGIPSSLAPSLRSCFIWFYWAFGFYSCFGPVPWAYLQSVQPEKKILCRNRLETIFFIKKSLPAVTTHYMEDSLRQKVLCRPPRQKSGVPQPPRHLRCCTLTASRSGGTYATKPMKVG